MLLNMTFEASDIPATTPEIDSVIVNVRDKSKPVHWTSCDIKVENNIIECSMKNITFGNEVPALKELLTAYVETVWWREKRDDNFYSTELLNASIIVENEDPLNLDVSKAE